MEALVTYVMRIRNPNRKEKKVNKWLLMGTNLGVSSAMHPFACSKILIQLGYEPVAPQPSTSLAGKPVLLLPNIIKYTANIRRQQGYFGCYRGLTPKIVGSVLSTIVSEKIADFLPFLKKKAQEDEDGEHEEDPYEEFKMNLKRNLVMSISSIIVSQPFHVISVRMIAQLVGRETAYNNMFGSIKEIYVNEGLLGFFSGLMPRLLYDVACIVITSSSVYALNKLIKDKKIRKYNEAAVQFAIVGVMYPLQVVSTCMAAKGSNLFIAKPPIMPDYKNWMDCWKDLASRGELKRGSVFFWRKGLGVLPEPPKRNPEFSIIF